MKKILITGKNSYVGTSFKKYVEENYADDYMIDEISVKGDDWLQADFSNYDVVLHVAGIAHVSTKENMKELYYQVNRDLTFEVAKKAKNDGVKQFIFMSSMIVYGKPKDGRVSKDTKPAPENFYGQSKLEAEELIKSIESENFKVAILRPPMIYGPGSKGNYPRLAKFAKISPLFPKIENKRSMLYIDILIVFIKNIIDQKEKGVFFPQNKDYVCTSRMVEVIAKNHDKKIYLTKMFNPFIKASINLSIINKLFGNLFYEKELSLNDFECVSPSFEKTISITESENENSTIFS